LRVSEAEFARRYGVSRPTVTRWKRAGHLKIIAGKVDVEISDALLHAAGLGEKHQSSAAAVDASLPAPPVGQQRDDPAPPPEPDQAENFLAALLSGNYGTRHEAERIKENALAGLRTLELQRRAGSLIELEAATTAFFECARATRDALTAWPGEVGPLLAADLDVPADRMTELLATHVRKLLAGLAGPDPGSLRRNG
jgi:hypothetical protein